MTRTRSILTGLAALALTVGLATQAQAAGHRRPGGIGGRSGRVGRGGPAVRIAPRPAVQPGRVGFGVRQVLAGVRAIIGGPRYVRPHRGHWETRTVRVLVQPAHWELRTIPARYELYRGTFGELVRVCVEPARTVRVWVADRYAYRTERVWVVR